MMCFRVGASVCTKVDQCSITGSAKTHQSEREKIKLDKLESVGHQHELSQYLISRNFATNLVLANFPSQVYFGRGLAPPWFARVVILRNGDPVR